MTKPLRWDQPRIQPIVEHVPRHDWCHLCGRVSAPQVFVRSSGNAQHPAPRGVRGSRMREDDPVLRVCVFCLTQMNQVMAKPEASQREIVHLQVETLETEEAVVYIVQSGEDGPVKIGSTYNVHQRIRNLQTGHPYKLRLLAAMQGDEELEKSLHEKFAEHRLEGEWFTAAPVIAWLRERGQGS